MKIHRQPDFFLIGLFLIPWAEARFQLFSQFRKGAPLFQLSKQVREEIDLTIGVKLNLRRSLRQDAVSLLINLSQLIHNKQQNSWPKWLKKKSYFRKSVFFYNLYTAAITGNSIDHLLQSEPQAEDIKEEIVAPTRNSSTPKFRPAFSEKSKGGIFGFKK
jgi:poly(A) polymerase